jgi:hypothetical protein
MVNATQAARAEGSTVIIPGSYSIVGRAGGIGTTLREVGREKVTVEVTIWASSEEARDEVGAAIEPHLRSIRRLKLVDQSIAMIWFDTVCDEDVLEKSKIYKRAFWVFSEYASTIAGKSAQVINFVLNIK